MAARPPICRLPPTGLVLALLLFASLACANPSSNLIFESGEKQISLVELYTSEGCSSCPPADRWLSGLKGNDKLWTDFAPVAFHVDNWNYIGWTDRFSDAAYTARQKNYVRSGNVRVAYTPGLFLNGMEWRGWYRGEQLESSHKVGNLRVAVGSGSAEVSFDPVSEHDEPLVVNVATLGMGLKSEVSNGENAGKLLQHDFVVLSLQTVPLRESAGHFTAKTALPASGIEANRYALVAWVSPATLQTPIQTVGGYLP